MKGSSITGTTGAWKADSQRWRTCPNTAWAISSASTPEMEMPLTELARQYAAYITSQIAEAAFAPRRTLPPNAADYAGWYEADSPRIELTHSSRTWLASAGFVSRTASSSSRIWGDGMRHSFPSAACSSGAFPKKDPAEPVATLALLAPNEEGRFIQAGTMDHHEAHPGMRAMLRLCSPRIVLLSIAVDSDLRAVLDSGRTQQEAPPPGRTRDADLAAPGSAEPGCRSRAYSFSAPTT